MADNIAVVVGAGPGLGSALIRRFSGAGMSVVAASRNPQALSVAIDKEKLLNVHLRTCDASAPIDVAALFETVSTELGRPNLVVFNAGAYERGDVIDIHPNDFDRCWRVGCFGGFLVGQEAAKLMLPAGSGTIVFTGATASLRGSAGFANLAVPKFGLRALSQSMARELGPRGIHIAHVIIDGQIESERYRDLLLERGSDSLLAPDAIAEAYYNLHLQQRSAWTLELDLRPWNERF
jgi:NAD(P)-dependent dehydrogenase (short-subunit alcohol dehydrogenase family)